MVALVAALVGTAGCGSDPSVRQSSDPADSSDQTQCAAPSVVSPPAAGKSTWKATKAAQVPSNQLPAEFGSPYAQPLASLAWEDGIYISRDGLNLYATYIPMDLPKAVLDGATPAQFYRYRRGPTLAGQDFPTTIAPPNPWIHADVSIARRDGTGEPFSTGGLSHLNKATGYNLGGFQGDLKSGGAGYTRAVYTDDELGPGGPKIALLRDVGLSPAYPGLGAALPAPLNGSGEEFDNSHIEKVGGTLVLFFDSQTLQGVSAKNVFYSTSTDDGATWLTPVNVTSVNTALPGGPGQQPHLYFDGSDWWLYFSAPNSGDGKLAIYRAKQGTPGNWNSFGSPALVVGAGTTSGVGEPTLTAQGDVSFVAITQNPSGAGVDTYDADPWFLPHK